MMKAMQEGKFQELPGMQPPGALFVPGNNFFGRAVMSQHEARLRAQVRRPSQTLVEQLDLPKEQGQVLEEVGANSAAAKAGLKKHDILLELNGKPVSSKPEEFRKMLKEVKANTPV